MSSEMPLEPIIEPELPIVDAHHHLFFLPEATLVALEGDDSIYSRSIAPLLRQHARYLFDEFCSDTRAGHNVRASVFVECHAMYRVDGPEAMQSVGEVEFANGVAAMAASGLFGDVRVCAGIVGSVDLRLGGHVEEILRAHIQAGGGRYRGVRWAGAYHDEDSRIAGADNGTPHLLLDSKFREGYAQLAPLGLSFDVFLLEPQIPDLIDLACAIPETQIVLNHVGGPLGVGRYAGQREERFSLWSRHIKALSRCTNVAVKLGGLGLPFGGFNSYRASPPYNSEQLAGEWRPYIEACIEAFGVDRCMFESNFPVDAAVGTYRVLWNAFKRLLAGASRVEKTALFSGTATRIYRLEL